MPTDRGPEEYRRRGLETDREPETEEALFSYPGDEDGDDDAERPRRLAQALIKAALAIVVVAGFVGVVWYAYVWGTGATGGNDGELPVITAQETPEKVKPEDPGGMDIPNRDKLVLNQDRGAGEPANVERLLPPPETPQPPNPEPEAESRPPQEGSEAARGEASPDTAGEGEGKRDVEEKAAEPVTGSETARAEPETDTTQEASETDSETVSEPDSATAETRESQDAARQTAARTQGEFEIQLVALRSEDSARSAWKQLQERFPTLLGQQSLSLETVEIEGKGTFYRVRTGPFPTKATAADLCQQLKARDQDCLVVTR